VRCATDRQRGSAAFRPSGAAGPGRELHLRYAPLNLLQHGGVADQAIVVEDQPPETNTSTTSPSFSGSRR